MAELETCKKKTVECGYLNSKQEGFIVACLPREIFKAFKKEPDGLQQPLRDVSCLSHPGKMLLQQAAHDRDGSDAGERLAESRGDAMGVPAP